MNEDEKEVIDSQDDTQNETVETNKTELTVDDYNKLKEERDALVDKNAKLYARIKKSSDSKPLAEKQSIGINPTDFARLKLQVENGITDPEALDFIMKNGGAEALKNPYIKKTIETMIEQKKAELAVVSGDSGKSEFDKKYSQEQLKSMSAEELEKILPHN